MLSFYVRPKNDVPRTLMNPYPVKAIHERVIYFPIVDRLPRHYSRMININSAPAIVQLAVRIGHADTALNCIRTFDHNTNLLYTATSRKLQVFGGWDTRILLYVMWNCGYPITFSGS